MNRKPGKPFTVEKEVVSGKMGLPCVRISLEWYCPRGCTDRQWICMTCDAGEEECEVPKLFNGLPNDSS